MTPEGIEIRRMRPEDEEEVSRLYVKSWREGYKGMLPQEYLDGLDGWRWNKKFTGLDGSFVLTYGGEIAGHSCARAAADKEMNGWGEVWTLYVLPEYWGRGFGTALLDNAEKWLSGLGFGDIYLWALETNVRARRFYESRGFAPGADTIQCGIAGITVTDVRYTKDIRGKLWQK